MKQVAPYLLPDSSSAPPVACLSCQREMTQFLLQEPGLCPVCATGVGEQGENAVWSTDSQIYEHCGMLQSQLVPNDERTKVSK